MRFSAAALAAAFACASAWAANAGQARRPAEKYAAMQAAVQKILDDAVASGAQTAVQCCAYIDGELAVDAWAGTYEKGGDRKIDGDSLFPIYSTGKPIFATAVNRAVEMGKMDYDAKICRLWPEFARNGKEGVTLRHVITHHSGLQGGVNGGTTDEQYCDWKYMTDQCAGFKPLCPPGTKAQYLSRTYAWLLGEPLSRAMKMSVRDAITQLVLKPAGIEDSFYFGVDSAALNRCVTVYNGNGKYNIEKMNLEIHRRACVPSSNAMASARGIAKFYVRLTGMDGKPPLLKPETLKAVTTPYFSEGESGKLKSGGMHGGDGGESRPKLVFGYGCFLTGKAPNYGDVFGQGGLGGSSGSVDVKKRLVFAYTCAVNSDSSPESNLGWRIRRAMGL